jgi:hypothetical protein
VRRFSDYSRLTLPELEAKVEHHKAVIKRLKELKLPFGANRMVLHEVESQIRSGVYKK